MKFILYILILAGVVICKSSIDENVSQVSDKLSREILHAGIRSIHNLPEHDKPIAINFIKTFSKKLQEISPAIIQSHYDSFVPNHSNSALEAQSLLFELQSKTLRSMNAQKQKRGIRNPLSLIVKNKIIVGVVGHAFRKLLLENTIKLLKATKILPPPRQMKEIAEHPTATVDPELMNVDKIVENEDLGQTVERILRQAVVIVMQEGSSSNDLGEVNPESIEDASSNYEKEQSNIVKSEPQPNNQADETIGFSGIDNLDEIDTTKNFPAPESMEKETVKSLPESNAELHRKKDVTIKILCAILVAWMAIGLGIIITLFKLKISDEA